MLDNRSVVNQCPFVKLFNLNKKGHISQLKSVGRLFKI